MSSLQSSKGTDDDVRLPSSATPKRYELRIEPDLGAATFHGTERVELRISECVQEVVCNAVELEISDVVFQRSDGTTLSAGVRYDDEAERAYFRPSASLDAGDWTLRLAFGGVLNDKLRGFYRSRFVDDEGNERWLATTQFEATDARRAFPCWDEPASKAVFSVTLVAPRDMMAISNGAVAEVKEIGGDRKEVHFADTVVMSTYLLAFIVGPLEQTLPIEVCGIPLSVVHTPGKSHLSSFALQAAQHALEFFSDWFAIAYPGDKMDLVAIPDFAFGAMENLGAVTFRESVLLIDPEQASRTELERVATVVSHEIAHMWFGDLVTMKWWNGLWLNEAFATFMEVLCVDHFKPEWDMWSGFAQERDDALAVDGLPGTRPIEHPVRHPKDAEDMFDRLTYEKGGAVLRMLEQFLGPEAFRDGIRLYIARHSFANAETTDLWDAIEESSGEPVRALMDTWIFQGGHPLVRVSDSIGESPEVVDSEAKFQIALTQEPFCYSAGDKGSIGDVWHVPIKLRQFESGEPLERKLVLQGATDLVDVHRPRTALFANSGGSGTYRTMYDEEALARLRPHLKELSALEQTVLISDSWALAISGHSNLAKWADLAFAIAEAATQPGYAPEPGVWGSMTSSLNLLDHMVSSGDRPALQAFAQSLLHPALQVVGFEEKATEAPLIGTMRGRLIAALGTIGADPQVKAWAVERFEGSKSGYWNLSADLLRPVLACVASDGKAEDYDTFLDRYRKASTPQEELRYLFALPEFGSHDLLGRTLALIDTEVRSQNAYLMYSMCLGNRENGLPTWRHVEQNWDDIVARLPSNALGRLIGGIEAQADPALADQVDQFLATHSVPSGQRQSELSLQRLKAQAAFAERERLALGSTLIGAIPPR